MTVLIKYSSSGVLSRLCSSERAVQAPVGNNAFQDKTMSKRTYKFHPRNEQEQLAMRLCRSRTGRLLLHLGATLRRPRNLRWHLRCMLRDIAKPPVRSRRES